MLLGDVGSDMLCLPKEHSGWHIFHGIQFLVLRFLSMLTWIPVVGSGMMAAQRKVLRQAAKRFQGGKRTKYELKHVPDDRHFQDMGIGQDDKEKEEEKEEEKKNNSGHGRWWWHEWWRWWKFLRKGTKLALLVVVVLVVARMPTWAKK